LKAPFPYFGGKSRVADLCWQAMGHCDNYVEPFAGSLAVLLARPQDRNPWPPKGETVNDLDGYVVNTWRAIQAAPAEVAALIERLGPSQELTLHAVNRELIARRGSITEELRGSVEWFDPVLASRWLWGICQWIGRGWAETDSTQKPHLGNWGRGVFSRERRDCITEVLSALSRRLRHARILSGEWSRCLSDSSLIARTNPAAHSTGCTSVGILLDPPYRAGNREDMYACESDVAQDVADWCREHGARPELRIVLCGIAGEHSMPSGWRYVDSMVLSKASRGKSKRQDRLLLSPHCLPVEGERPVDPGQPVRRRQRSIYDLLGGSG
jgi:DNA adenine methylase